MLFGRGSGSLEADDDEIADQVCADVFRAAPYVILLELSDSFADGGFDLSLRFHRMLEGVPILTRSIVLTIPPGRNLKTTVGSHATFGTSCQARR
jgi:hypothetical protein